MREKKNPSVPNSFGREQGLKVWISEVWLHTPRCERCMVCPSLLSLLLLVTYISCMHNMVMCDMAGKTMRRWQQGAWWRGSRWDQGHLGRRTSLRPLYIMLSRVYPATQCDITRPLSPNESVDPPNEDEVSHVAATSLIPRLSPARIKRGMKM